jgi:hypothetical protein
MGKGKKFWNDQDISRKTPITWNKIRLELTKINFET